MKPVLPIQIGNAGFTSRDVDMRVIQSGIEALLQRIGLDVSLELTRSASASFITIANQVCYFPASIEEKVAQYVSVLPLPDEAYWHTLTQSIIWYQPQLLITEDMVPEFFPLLETMPVARRPALLQSCKTILGELLELKLSLRNISTIHEIANNYLEAEQTNWNELRETLITALNERIFRLCIHPDHFQRMLFSHHGDNLFTILREALFYENGILVPAIQVDFQESLVNQEYYFSFNAFTSIPIVSVPDPVSNDSLQLCLDHFKSFLKQQVFGIVESDFFERQLMAMETTHPNLVKIIRQKEEYPLSIKVVRLLAREGISIRNLPLILEAILASDYIIADDHTYIIFDDRIAVNQLTTKAWKQDAHQVVEFVRIRMKRQISYQYTKGESTLTVYLLDPEIEKWIDTSTYDVLRADEAMIEKIHNSVEKELEALPAGSKIPTVLTLNKVRQSIHNILAARFPEIHVVSYQELSTDMNIQPIARITV